MRLSFLSRSPKSGSCLCSSGPQPLLTPSLAPAEHAQDREELGDPGTLSCKECHGSELLGASSEVVGPVWSPSLSKTKDSGHTHRNRAAGKGIPSEGAGFLGATLKNALNRVIPVVVIRAQ